MSGGILVTGADLKVTLFNQRYVDLHGYPGGVIGVGFSLRDEALYLAKR
jgi:hypothetical protein